MRRRIFYCVSFFSMAKFLFFLLGRRNFVRHWISMFNIFSFYMTMCVDVPILCTKTAYTNPCFYVIATSQLDIICIILQHSGNNVLYRPMQATKIHVAWISRMAQHQYQKSEQNEDRSDLQHMEIHFIWTQISYQLNQLCLGKFKAFLGAHYCHHYIGLLLTSCCF